MYLGLAVALATWYNNRKAANPSGDHLFPNTIMRRRENES